MQNNLIGIVLLAAGESARLGEPKQLLQFQGETLLRRSVKIAMEVCDKIVVTLGAKIEILRREIEDLPVNIVENKDWKSGMSGSLKVGLEKLLGDNKNLNGVLVMVCDQPFVDAVLLAKIIETLAETDALIVACEYRNAHGVPALFHRTLFPEIFALNSPKGARQLIKKYRGQTVGIAFPEGAFDIDTPDDYQNLMKNLSGRF